MFMSFSILSLSAPLVYSVYCGPGSVHQRAGRHCDSAWGSHCCSGPQWQRAAISAAKILRGCQRGNKQTCFHTCTPTHTKVSHWTLVEFYLEDSLVWCNCSHYNEATLHLSSHAGFWIMGVGQGTGRAPTHAQGEHANFTKKGGVKGDHKYKI